jgi:hypothetical protein
VNLPWFRLAGVFFGDWLGHVAQGDDVRVFFLHPSGKGGVLEFVLPQGGFATVRAIRRGEVIHPCACDGKWRVLLVLQPGEFGFASVQLGDNGFQARSLRRPRRKSP